MKKTVGISNPLLDKTRFELIPIVEWYPGDGEINTAETQRYSDLCCRNEPKQMLSTYLPSQFRLDAIPHLDPNIYGFTYAEPTCHYSEKQHRWKRNPKADVLQGLAENDYVVFAASLAPFPSESRPSISVISDTQTNHRAKFIIGYFRVRGVFECEKRGDQLTVRREILGSKEECKSQLITNAHSNRSSGAFVCVAGHPRRGGLLLERAVELTGPPGFRLTKELGEPLLKECGGRTYNRGYRRLNTEAIDLLCKRRILL
jgi:hypothetical protein